MRDLMPFSERYALPGRIAVVCACFVLLTALALAHSPYVSGRIDWAVIDGKHYKLAMLWGDGIIGPDPGRPVVLDEAGKILALGPLVTDAYVHCRSGSDCIVIVDGDYHQADASWPEAVAPDPSAFRTGRAADFYPEFEKAAYGFQPVSLTLSDRLVALTIAYRREPLFAVAWTLLYVWLGLKCGSVLLLAQRIGRNSHAPMLVRILDYGFSWTGLALLAALGPLVVVAMSRWLPGWALHQPPLLVVFGAAYVVGAVRALVRLIVPLLSDRSHSAGAAT